MAEVTGTLSEIKQGQYGPVYAIAADEGQQFKSYTLYPGRDLQQHQYPQVIGLYAKWVYDEMPPKPGKSSGSKYLTGYITLDAPVGGNGAAAPAMGADGTRTAPFTRGNIGEADIRQAAAGALQIALDHSDKFGNMSFVEAAKKVIDAEFEVMRHVSKSLHSFRAPEAEPTDEETKPFE
jgi:hypothetical protein